MSPETRRLGKSDLWITRVGIGTAPIGSTPEWKIYWGSQDETEALAALHAALDLGVNWIDTAPFYGWGRAEQLVGKALRGRRSQVYLFTKCGTLRTEDDNWYESLKPESIRREVETSLRNLQTDYIDLYQFHDTDSQTPIEESWAAMQQLIVEGKVRYGGLSNHSPDLIARALAVGPVVSNQHQYSLLERGIEADVLPFSQTHGIGVLAWSPLASGFLADGFDLERLEADDFRRHRPFAREPYWSKIQRVRTVLGAIAQAHGKKMVHAAIAWTLRHPALTGAIIGIRNATEAAEMLGGVGWQLTEDEALRLEQALA